MKISTLPQKAIFPGRYVQEAGALRLLPEVAHDLGSRILVIGGQTALSRSLPSVERTWKRRFSLAVEGFQGECTDAEIKRLSQQAKAHRADVVLGLGGGKVMDTAKVVADRQQAACIIAPTIASTDAPCSAVAVIYDRQGSFVRYHFTPRNPDLVLVDTAVIAAAPVRFLVAGMGDALSTWFEADACRRSNSSNQCGGRGLLAAYALARLCYDTIREHGPSALAACSQGVTTPALEHIVEANTLLSGLGFESAGLASAHSIHNGLTCLPGTHDYYHGEKVTIGVLAGLFLADRSREQIEEVYRFCEEIGLPTTLSAIGLEGVTDRDLRKVAKRACLAEETIHHEACSVSPAAVVAALKTADRLGCDRLSKRGERR